MSNKLFFSFWILVSMMLYNCDSPKPTILQPGVSKSLADQRKSNIDNVKYQLDLIIPDSLQKQIIGSVTVLADLKSAKRDLVLDFKNSKEQVIEVNIAGASVDYRFENEHIIVPSENLNEGKNEVTIGFIAGEQALNRNEDYLYALFVPDKASTAFPCFDQPNIKASFELSLTIPSEWIAFTNYPVATQEKEDGSTFYQFEPTLPISTYLFAFGVGNFQSIKANVGGREMSLYHRESDEEKVKRNAHICFDLHSKALNWLEDYTGIKYPFKKFDFALIPAFQFGGMEHPGAIWYRDRSLFLDENATVNQKMGRNSLIAHETAHMWFGDLVTMDWFDDVWLKEVFANFMAAKMVNPNFPDIDHDLRFLLRHHPAAYGEDRSAGTHPIQQNLVNLNQASLLYGRIIYQKAPVVMKQLESVMGEQKFQEGLQEYLETYAFDNATWDDLINILDKRTDLDLATWSAAWVKESGMPHLKAELETDGQTIQNYSLDFMNATSNDNIWQQKTILTTSTNGRIETMPIALNDRSNSIDRLKDASLSDFILPSTSEKGYGYFELDSRSTDYLMENVYQISDDLTKSSAWFSLWEGMLRGDIHPEKLLRTITKALPLESDIQGLTSRLGYLRSIYWGYLNDTYRSGEFASLADDIWQLMIVTSDNGKKKTLFDTYISIALETEDVDRLIQLWNKEIEIEGLSLSENDFITLAYELAVREVQGAEKILESQLDNVSNKDRRDAMAFVIPALSEDKVVRDQFFESLKKLENRKKEPWVITALSYLNHPLRAGSAEKYIQPGLGLVREIQLTGTIFFPKRWSSTLLSGHSSAASLAIVDQFLNELPNDYPEKLKYKIQQSADPLRRKVKWASREEVE
ncbi:MAG: peptidase M1 [Bacteroidia bacterium]|nr:peptidase M1 [Bacteroidia bacterium]